MRLAVTIATAALGLSLVTLAALWGVTQIALVSGAPLPSMQDSWMAALGFAALPIAGASVVVLVLLGAAWIVRDLLRVRA